MAELSTLLFDIGAGNRRLDVGAPVRRNRSAGAASAQLIGVFLEHTKQPGVSARRRDADTFGREIEQKG